jgi:pectinesterase
VQIDKVNILGRQNTFFVRGSRCYQTPRRHGQKRYPRRLQYSCWLPGCESDEGDVDIVSGRGAVVFDNTDFRVVNSRTQKEAYVLQTVLHAAVGHEEGVLAAKNVHLIDLHLVAIAA